MDKLDFLVKHLMQTGYEDMSTELIEGTKVHIVDILGTIIAGSGVAESEKVRNFYKDWGRSGESSILVFGDKVPMSIASIVNGTMARAHDLDDVHEVAVSHIGVSIVPSALAVSEHLHSDGKSLIAAICLGYDLASRISLAACVPPGVSGMNIGYHSATFASAALYGKLAGFSEEKIKDAMGIAFCEVSGTDQCLIEGSFMVALEQGLSGGKGITAALLAEHGINGPHNLIDGKFGYYNSYQHGQYDGDKLVAGLGNVYEGENVSIKMYPCCKFTHSAIEGVLLLVKRYEITPEDVKAIKIKVSRQAYTFACDPLKHKYSPRSDVEAKFSLPYVVAAAIVKKRVWIDDFEADAISDESVLEVARKVEPVIDEEIDRASGKIIGPSEVEVTLRDGRTLSARVDYVNGHPKNPITMDMCIKKFMSCLDFSAHKLDEKRRNTLIESLRHLEEIGDIGEIISAVNS